MADNNDPPKNDPPADPPKNDPPAGSPKNDPPKDDAPKDDDKDSLRTVVREELAKLMEGRTGRGGDRASIEQRAEILVQEAAARLENKKKDEDRDREVSDLRDQVKKLTERPPMKQSRLSKAIWGDASKDDR